MARAIISDHLEDLWQKQLMIIHNGLNTFGAVSFEVHSELYDNCSTTGCRLVLYAQTDNYLKNKITHV